MRAGMRAGTLPVLALTALVAACTPGTPATGDSTPVPAATHDSTPVIPARGDSTPTPAATRDSTPAPASTGGAQEQGRTGQPLTVREVLAPSVRVGEQVRVTGQCRGYSDRSTLGTPPVSRSDWELLGDGASVWVNGTLPEGCSVTEGSEAQTTIDARVAEDTLRALGGRPPTPRRYLVRVTR